MKKFYSTQYIKRADACRFWWGSRIGEALAGFGGARPKQGEDWGGARRFWGVLALSRERIGEALADGERGKKRQAPLKTRGKKTASDEKNERTPFFIACPA